ncbi:MAG TPA: tetratricopeptide repeat protein [Pyrinomonadaceae bacterium]|nr:tetratricopeptide repeat protein [Pyrinomonadaceae bacterium]
MIPSDQWEKVKTILQAAIDLPDGDRAAFIDKESAGDEDVRSEVETLLEAHDEAGTFIGSPIASVSDLLGGTQGASREGQEIGAYKILREVGRGGMGAVYLAERADSQFKKQVAVKLIKRGLDTDEIVSRFRNERQILASLEHPNIARLLDGGATDDGLPFLVMEYVEGTKLTTFCNDRALGINERLDIFLAACSAVAHAHRNLIVHRDLKPSNIFVTADGQPKLLDFGIATLLTPSGDLATRRTSPDLNVMTPEYASPEQVLGEPVTTQSDVYSLGVILYELLSGSRPYEFESRSLEKILRTVCDFEPARPSSRSHPNVGDVDVRPLNRKSLRGDLDNIVLMAIRKEHERRYTSVEQFAEDIRRFLAGLPVIAREDTFGYRASKFIRRNRAGVAASAGIGLSLIGGLAMTMRQSRIARRQRDKAERINRFLQRTLASADPRAAGRDAKVTEVLKLAADAIESDFAAQPDIAADLNTTIGLTFLSLGQVEDAEPHLEHALDARSRLYGPVHPETAVAMNNFGRVVQSKGDLRRAESLFRRSLSIMRRSRSADPLDVASVLGNLGYLLMLEAIYDEAIDMHGEELAILGRTRGEHHPEFARTLGNLANIYAAIGDTVTAEPMHRRALTITRRYYRGEHPDIAQAMLHLAIPIQAAKPNEAEDLCRSSLEMRRRFFGDGHPETAWSRYHLGGVLLRQGEYGEALECSDAILRYRGDSIPEMHSIINSTLLMRARGLGGLDRWSDAEPLVRECIKLRERTLPADHWLIDAALGYLGECLLEKGHFDEAAPLIRKCYFALRDKLGPEHEHTRSAKRRLVRL